MRWSKFLLVFATPLYVVSHVNAQEPLRAGPEPAPQPALEAAPPVPPPQSTLQPALPEQAFNAWAQLSKARLLVRGGRALDALPLLRSFVSEKPEEPEGYFWEGVCLDNLGDCAGAMHAYAAAIGQVAKAGMDSAELRMNYANTLFKLGQLETAIQQYRRAEEIDPRVPLVPLNLGRALLQKGDVDNALKCFQRCDELHMTAPQLGYYRAKALLKAGRTAEARNQLEATLMKLPVQDEMAKKIKQEFAELLETQGGAASGVR
jgi:tetratricopeptide (TPR) repeat protein